MGRTGIEITGILLVLVAFSPLAAIISGILYALLVVTVGMPIWLAKQIIKSRRG